MTTTLEDTNASPLSTITFSPEPDNIFGNFSRVGEKGEKVFNYSTETLQGNYDMKLSAFIYTLHVAVKDSATFNLLTEYFLKENKTGFKLTIPNKPTTVGEPFNHSYLLVSMPAFTHVDIGGTEKPYYLVTLTFRIATFTS